jgi:hypothetical protein
MGAMVYRGPYKVRVEKRVFRSSSIPMMRSSGFNWRQFADTTAPLPRPDARHPSRSRLRPRIHRCGRRSGFFGADREARGPGNGALQHLLGSCFFCARGLYSNCHNVNPNATAVGGIYLARAEVPGAGVAVRRRCGPQERQAR